MDVLSNISLPQGHGQGQGRGSSSLHTALNFMQTHFFTHAAGARDGVPKVVIVLTDGRSSNQTLALQAAANIKGTGVQVIAVSLGAQHDRQTLSGLASSDSGVFSVSDVRAPLDYVKNVTEFLCRQISTNTEAKRRANCTSERPADVLFILDSSTSEGQPGFSRQKDFVSGVVSQLHIGPAHFQVGLMTYSTYVHNQFDLNTYSSQAPLLAAVSRVQLQPGASYTEDALRFAYTHSFNVYSGQRVGAVPVVVLLSDGQSYDSQRTQQEASVLRSIGATVMVVGIGRHVNWAELKGIASDTAHVYNVTSSHFLSDIEHDVANEIRCGSVHLIEETVPTTTQLPDTIPTTTQLPDTSPVTTQQPDTSPMTTQKPACQGTEEADVLLFLDASSQSGQPKFGQEVTFATNLINSTTIGPHNMQFGVMTYAQQPNAEFWFNSYTDKAAIISALQGLAVTGGSPNLDQALKFAREYAYAPFHGTRADVPNYTIIVTTGVTQNLNETIRQADELKHGGVVVMAVGVGDAVKREQLSAIATDSGQVFLLSDSDLASLHDQLTSSICLYVNSLSSSPAPSVTDMMIG